MEKNRIIKAELPTEEVELTNPDFVKLAESCGIKGIRIDSLENLKNAIINARNSDVAVLIDVPVNSPIIPSTKLS